MSRTLTLYEHSSVYTTEGYKDVKDLGESFTFIDPWGVMCAGGVKISEIQEHKPLAITTQNGQMLLPDSCSFLTRGSSACFKNTTMKELDLKEAHAVIRAMRKINPWRDETLLEQLFNKLELGSKNELYFDFKDQLGDAIDFIPKLAGYGIDSEIDQENERLLIDPNRPPCFASKLFAGVFTGEQGEKAFADLVGGGTIVQTGHWDYFYKTARHQLIPEGTGYYNMLFILTADELTYRPHIKKPVLYDVHVPTDSLLEVDFFNI